MATEMIPESSPRIVVVGAGLAGLCAALAAHEAGARVLVLEASPRHARGGNSRFSNGSFRLAHDGLGYGGPCDLELLVVPDSQPHADRVRVTPYPAEQFADDIRTTSRGRTNEVELGRVVQESFDVARWLADHGVRWELNLKFAQVSDLDSGQTIDLDPGASLAAVGSGPGLMNALFAAVESAGIEIRYETVLDDFIVSDGSIVGVRVCSKATADVLLGTVILATGGFEANPEMRRKYLGPGWDLVAVRGSRYNTGRGLVRALELGAMPGGHWGGCHSVPTDADIPLVGDPMLSSRSERYSYADGILVNEEGRRFIDEGEDNFTMTYTKVGEAICAQPGSVAYQIFDARTSNNLHQHYYSHGKRILARSIDELARKLGIAPRTLESTIAAFNSACPQPADVHVRDRRADPVDQPPKSHWASPMDQPPFVAYKVTSGISFTYGGIVTNADMQVRHIGEYGIGGLYAAGGVVGGLFFHNYPAAASLTRAAVCGRAAGWSAAKSPAITPGAASRGIDALHSVQK